MLHRMVRHVARRARPRSSISRSYVHAYADPSITCSYERRIKVLLEACKQSDRLQVTEISEDAPGPGAGADRKTFHTFLEMDVSPPTPMANTAVPIALGEAAIAARAEPGSGQAFNIEPPGEAVGGAASDDTVLRARGYGMSPERARRMAYRHLWNQSSDGKLLKQLAYVCGGLRQDAIDSTIAVIRSTERRVRKLLRPGGGPAVISTMRTAGTLNPATCLHVVRYALDTANLPLLKSLVDLLPELSGTVKLGTEWKSWIEIVLLRRPGTTPRGFVKDAIRTLICGTIDEGRWVQVFGYDQISDENAALYLRDRTLEVALAEADRMEDVLMKSKTTSARPIRAKVNGWRVTNTGVHMTLALTNRMAGALGGTGWQKSSGSLYHEPRAWADCERLCRLRRPFQMIDEKSDSVRSAAVAADPGRVEIQEAATRAWKAAAKKSSARGSDGKSQASAKAAAECKWDADTAVAITNGLVVSGMALRLHVGSVPGSDSVVYGEEVEIEFFSENLLHFSTAMLGAIDLVNPMQVHPPLRDALIKAKPQEKVLEVHRAKAGEGVAVAADAACSWLAEEKELALASGDERARPVVVAGTSSAAATRVHSELKRRGVGSILCNPDEVPIMPTPRSTPKNPNPLRQTNFSLRSEVATNVGYAPDEFTTAVLVSKTAVLANAEALTVANVWPSTHALPKQQDTATGSQYPFVVIVGAEDASVPETHFVPHLQRGAQQLVVVGEEDSEGVVPEGSLLHRLEKGPAEQPNTQAASDDREAETKMAYGKIEAKESEEKRAKMSAYSTTRGENIEEKVDIYLEMDLSAEQLREMLEVAAVDLGVLTRQIPNRDDDVKAWIANMVQESAKYDVEMRALSEAIETVERRV